MTNKKTKKEYFNEIKALEQVAANQDYVDFLEKEIALLEKKSANKKPTKVQEQNEVIKGAILEVLSENGETVTEIMKKVSVEGVELSNQKVSALLRQMIEVGTVVKVVEGKKSLFKRA